MDSREGIVCRPATHSDCDPTMDINRNVYGGLDYLQYKFHNFIDDPLRFPFVAVLNGLIVGYKCGYVIDDGMSLVSEAIRVHPDHQGKGIMSKLDQEVMVAALDRFPTIQRTIWTAVDLERTMHKLNKDKTVQLLAQRPRVGFDSTGEDLKRLCSSSKFHDLLEKYKVINISAVPRRHAIDILTNHTDFTAAVPEDMLLVNFAPWGLHRQTYIELLKLSTLHVSDVGAGSLISSVQMAARNVPKLTGSDPSRIGSDSSPTGSDPSQSDPLPTGNLAVSGARSVRCFSFHSVTPSIVGARFRVDFYCPVGENANEMAIAHILYHIREFVECNQAKEVSFGMLFGQHIDKPTLKKMLTDELGLNTSTTPESTGLLISMPYTAA